MNNKVTVTGMTVTTTVGSNLLITDQKGTSASHTQLALTDTAKADDSLFVTSVSTVLSSAKLEPVSTHTAKNFFYTLNAKSDGDAIADDYSAYNAAEVPTSEELTAFANAYGASGAVGYKDYVFQLKAVNAQAAAKDIKMTKLELIYTPGTQAKADAGQAFRVAVLTEEYGDSAFTNASGTLKNIYATTASTNQTANYAVSAASTAPTALTTAYNAGANVATVDANSTKYYKVVVRLYLEGEDTTCKNDTYAKLDGNWALNLELALDDATTNTAVTSLAKYTKATVSTTDYYYDGTTVYTLDAGIYTAVASPSNDVKTAFGITT